MNFDSSNLTVPRGKLLFAPFLAGTTTPGAFIELGNCPQFTLSRETQKLMHYSSQRGMKNKDEEIVIDSSMSGSITTDDMKATNKALWFMSDEAVITTTSATGVVEMLNDVELGGVYQLGRSDATPTGVRKVTSVVVEVASVAKTLNTDYLLDADLGLVTILATGTITAGADVEVTYNVSANTRSQIATGETEVEGELKLISYNAAGPQSDYTIPRCVIAPNGDIALLQDPESTAWQTMGFSVTALKKGNLALVYVDGRPA